jgi:hypothetical protein
MNMFCCKYLDRQISSGRGYWKEHECFRRISSLLVDLLNHVVQRAAFQVQGGTGGQGLDGVDDVLLGPLPSADGPAQDSERAVSGDSKVGSVWKATGRKPISLFTRVLRGWRRGRTCAGGRRLARLAPDRCRGVPPFAFQIRARRSSYASLMEIM